MGHQWYLTYRTIRKKKHVVGLQTRNGYSAFKTMAARKFCKVILSWHAPGKPMHATCG